MIVNCKEGDGVFVVDFLVVFCRLRQKVFFGRLELSENKGIHAILGIG